MINIKQLGNGSAFNHKMTNSSFLIKDSNKDFMLLFDCGESVFAELRRQDESEEINLKDLTDVFISHMDGDHVGSLKTLIYYMYFVHNKVLRIRFAKSIEAQISSFLEDITGYNEFNEHIEAQLFIKLPFDDSRNWAIINFLSIVDQPSSYVLITPLKAQHGTKSCFGLNIVTEKSYFLISGDTTVTYESHNIFKSNINSKEPKRFICFHDYSKFNQPERQVHACESSFKRDYTKEFLDSVVTYHDDRSDFYKEWFGEDMIDLIVSENNYNTKREQLK